MRHLLSLLVINLVMCVAVACGSAPQATEIIPTRSANPVALPTATSEQTDPRELHYLVLAKPQMSVERAAHTATLIPAGTVLVAGGFTSGEQALASAELFDPITRTFSPTGGLSVPRQSHSATLLPNGKVLIAGGFNGEYLASAEIYDPGTGLFTPTGSMGAARSGHTAVLLMDGKVLVAGGTGKGWTFLATAEIYDPELGTFSATGDMTLPRESHTATLLSNGEVLITGGHRGRQSAITIYDSAELYDPSSGTFTATGQMTIKRHKHDATLLADGRVFISGGSDERDSEGAYRSTEIYDPATGAFGPAGEMHAARYKHTGTSLLLQNGQVLLLAGASTAELFDPQNGKFYPVADGLAVTRLFATATLLPDGEILFAGGYGSTTAASTQAWVLSSGSG